MGSGAVHPYFLLCPYPLPHQRRVWRLPVRAAPGGIVIYILYIFPAFWRAGVSLPSVRELCSSIRACRLLRPAGLSALCLRLFLFLRLCRLAFPVSPLVFLHLFFIVLVPFSVVCPPGFPCRFTHFSHSLLPSFWFVLFSAVPCQYSPLSARAVLCRLPAVHVLPRVCSALRTFYPDKEARPPGAGFPSNCSTCPAY